MKTKLYLKKVLAIHNFYFYLELLQAGGQINFIWYILKKKMKYFSMETNTLRSFGSEYFSMLRIKTLILYKKLLAYIKRKYVNVILWYMIYIDTSIVRNFFGLL